MINIYVLIDPETNEIRYVGKTKKDIEKRLKEHILETRYKSSNYYHCKKWIKKLLEDGKKPIIQLLEVCSDDYWEEREQYWIEKFLSDGIKLTNLTKGGKGHSRVNYKPLYKNWKKIDVYTKYGEFLYTCGSIAEAEKKTGCGNSNISSICKRNRYNCKNYTFRYHGEPLGDIQYEFCNNCVEVCVFDENLKLLKVCKSCPDAEKFTGVDYRAIKRCCRIIFFKNGKRIFYNGFHFLYRRNLNKIDEKYINFE